MLGHGRRTVSVYDPDLAAGLVGDEDGTVGRLRSDRPSR
jgi:hypothetical protein